MLKHFLFAAVVIAAAVGIFLAQPILAEKLKPETTATAPKTESPATQQTSSQAATTQQPQLQPAQMPPKVQAEPVVISDAKMEEFIKVNQKLNTLQRSFQKNMTAAAGDQKKIEDAMMEKNKTLQSIFGDTTLSIPEYSGIAKALPSDPKLQEQFAKLIK